MIGCNALGLGLGLVLIVSFTGCVDKFIEEMASYPPMVGGRLRFALYVEVLTGVSPWLPAWLHEKCRKRSDGHAVNFTAFSTLVGAHCVRDNETGAKRWLIGSDWLRITDTQQWSCYNEARPRERSHRGRCLPLGKKASS